MWWSSSSVNNEGTLDYPDILIAGVGKTECGLNSQEHCNVIVGSLFDNLYSRILYSEML